MLPAFLAMCLVSTAAGAQSRLPGSEPAPAHAAARASASASASASAVTSAVTSASPSPSIDPAAEAGEAASAKARAEAQTAATPGLVLPAAEIVSFQFLLNRVNRYWGSGREDYRVTGSSIERNLRSSWGTDRDPFNVNQLGHPYQGAMYHGFGRSVGLDYWHSLGLAFAGSAVWEIAGERTRPSRNDQVASGIGGTFLGEALFRMSSLVLEKGGGLSPFWREAAAAAIDPAAGFNRLLYRDRENAPFSSHGAVYSSRLGLGYAGTVKRQLGTSEAAYRRNEAQLDFAIDYGLPGSRGYEYTRPFDYFAFQATASSANGVESVLTRGLLVGRSYEAGPRYRGVWGLYGNFAYVAPQTFRISTSALSLGTTGQWWLSDTVSLQGTAMAGVGYAAVGTTHGRAGERDYNYGLAPQATLALRLTHNDTVSLDLTGREFFVSRVASGTTGGHDNIVRGDVALTFRVARQHAVTFKVLANRRDARFVNPGTERQTQVTLGVFYTVLGQDRFGAVDWR